MTEYSQFLDSIDQRMDGTKFRVSRDQPLPDGSVAGLAASRNRFIGRALSLISQHVLVTYRDTPTKDDFESLFKTGFDYAKKVNRVPLLRGLQFGYMVVPCIAAPSIGDDVIRYVTGQPAKRWSLFEMPVAVELSTGESHYFEGRSMWGALLFSGMREIVTEYVVADA